MLILKFLNDNAGALSLLATIALAVLTFFLWRSTDKLWRSGKESFEATERAFVFLDGFEPEITTAAQALGDIDLPDPYRGREDLFITRFAVRPRWRNSGTTPTVGMTVKVNWTVTQKGFPPKFNFVNQPTPFFVPPQGTEIGDVIEITAARSLVDYGLTQKGDEPSIWIWGRADYRDVFGKPHFVEWFYELTFDAIDGHSLRARYLQAGDHNCTDDG